MDLSIETKLGNSYGVLTVKRIDPKWYLELGCCVSKTTRQEVSFRTCEDILKGVLYNEYVMEKITNGLQSLNSAYDHTYLSPCGEKLIAEVWSEELEDYEDVVLGEGKSHLELIVDAFDNL